ASWGSENSESCVQILVGLSEMGIPLDDSRFVKNGKTVLDSVMAYYVKGKGFFHTKVGDGSNQMASEQGLYALVAAQRAMTGKPSLYRMTDPLKIGANAVDIDGSGLPSKNKDVKTPKVSLVGKTFLDVQAHANQPAIEALAARQIINGKTDDKFDPNATMTRAEFATIVVKALGLNPKANNTFADVKSTDWFASFVGTANSSGIVTGISAKKFDPNGTITREEAATMVARAAKLCGMDTKYEAMAARDILSQFPDYVQISEWAKAPMAFCYDTKLLDASAKDVLPKLAIKRCEIAQILFNMLTNAKLL
ncbi:MAG: S-layer homology domain-containing protein, partial [Clostridiales bacterium]